MPIGLQISPRLVQNVASIYNDPNRIFMEYIDNSLDSAEHWFDHESDSYTKPIEISLKLEGKNKKEGKVIIIDNCFGITNFKKVVQSIGDSDKKRQGFTNGEFGYGIYSFMAACERLEITSKEEKKDGLYLPILCSQFNESRQENVSFPDPRIIKRFPFQSGTIITLSEFDQNNWRSINIDDLIREIEKHFELLLKRKNLSIKIIENSNIRLCKPFDYFSIEGDTYEDYVTNFLIKDKRVKAGDVAIKIKKPVHIFLKMTKGMTINRPPVFISRGRHICEIKDVKSFNSKHKSDIWSHPSVTGFIDLKDLLGPTIARNDFRNNNESKALFNTLYELETLILDFVKKSNLKSEERHYEQLEDLLNEALSKLARLDSMNFRTDHIKGGDINLKTDAFGAAIEEGKGAKDQGDGEIINPGGGDFGGVKGSGAGPSDTKEGELPTDKKGGDKIDGEEQFEDSDIKGRERKKSGFNIRISDAEPQIDSETKKQVRSLLVGNEIIIYKNHPDFKNRVKYSRPGETKITDRLITYIAGEITVLYKDRFYNKVNQGAPDYNINLFIGLVDFLYQYEEMLSPLSGKNLSDL